MALTTRTVTVQITGPSGAGLAGCTVSASLTRADRDPTAGWVLPNLVTGTTDADGIAALTLWPTDLGSDGSKYRFTATDPDGVLLFDVVASTPDADCLLAELDFAPGEFPPWPAADTAREARLVQDVADLLQEPAPSAETQRKIKRWIGLVLQHMASVRPWRFLENQVQTSLGPGIDTVDLLGDLGQVLGLVGPDGRLVQVTLGSIAEYRALAGADRQRGGRLVLYALEGGRRVHVWPAPDEDTPLVLHYQRPMQLALVPDDLEPVIVNGVLGRYGRHFDRDALTQDPVEFETRYMRDLRAAGRDSWDATLVYVPLEVLASYAGDRDGATTTATIQLP
jgi:hypothetical protein